MSEPSYFDDPQEADKFRVEAISWLGTPFRPYLEPPPDAPKQEPKGNGIDCVGLVQEVFARSGAARAFFFPRTLADYEPHQSGEKILDYLRGKSPDPQSKELAALLVELEIPDVFKDPNAESPRDFFKPGDILVLRHGSLFHMPILIDRYLHFVNAVPRMGVIEGTIQDSTFSRHLVAAFRLRPRMGHL